VELCATFWKIMRSTFQDYVHTVFANYVQIMHAFTRLFITLLVCKYYK